MSQLYFTFYHSPVGKLLLLFSEQGLIGVEFDQEQSTTDLSQFEPVERASGTIQAIFYQTEQWLNRYFQGEPINGAVCHFLHLKGTPFQQAVWQALLSIPYGQMVSYAELAEKIGKPKAVRAVGGAVGRNPISIIVPCHRILGKDGKLTGFGGGLAAKRFLLQLEQVKFKEGGQETVRPKQKHWEKY